MILWIHRWLVEWIMGRQDPSSPFVSIRRLGWRGRRYRCVYHSTGLSANYDESCYVEDLRLTVDRSGLGTVTASHVRYGLRQRPSVSIDIDDAAKNRPAIRDMICRFDFSATGFSALDSSQSLKDVDRLVDRFVAPEPILALVDRLVYRQSSLRDGLMRVQGGHTFDPDERGTRLALRLALRKIAAVERRCLKLTHPKPEAPIRLKLPRYAGWDIEDDVCESQLPPGIRPLSGVRDWTDAD